MTDPTTYHLEGKTLAIEYADGRREFFDVLGVEEIESGKFSVKVKVSDP